MVIARDTVELEGSGESLFDEVVAADGHVRSLTICSIAWLSASWSPYPGAAVFGGV